MQLNENQKQAVEYLEGPLLVLAGPGTGKTQLLSERVVHILKSTDTNPENILCLTFTDVGAFNMRERLKSIIGREGSKVNVSTYHAFGSNILAQYREYNENYDRNLDSPLDDVAQYKIIKMLQDELSGTDILRGDSIKDIKDTVSDTKKARFTTEDLLKIAEQNNEDSVEITSKVAPLLLNVVKGKYKESLEGAYLPIYKELERYLDAKVILPGVERISKLLTISLKDALDTAADKNSVAPLTKWREDHFEKDKRGHYRLNDRIANKKLASFAKLMEKYDKYLQDNAMFDYDDMIEEAVQALAHDDGFRMTLQERYQYILLDEFQDTNPSQFAIVKALTNYEKPMVMAVGDDDQAIYEFQGALSTNMKDFQEYYKAKVIPLVENYRSTQEILDFSREIIKQAPDKKFEAKNLIAHKDNPKESQIYRYEFGASDAEYGFIAAKIDELIKSGVNQNEIAVITRKNKYFEPLLPYLKDYPSIKIAYEKRDNLFDDEKMHEIFTISKYVYEIANNKTPSVQLMEILSYPCFEVPLLEVLKLNNAARFECRNPIEFLAENGSGPIKGVLEFLSGLAAKSFVEPLENILFDISERLKPELLGDYERFCFYENLASLKGKLRNHYGEKKLKLVDLIEMLDDYESAEMPLTISSPYKDADEAVKLMTVHGAKGLEFEYVFIVSADNKAWGKAKGNNNFLTLPKNLQQIRHTGITDSERLRVMYVALTRAKHTLIITNSVRDFAGTAPARLEYFDEHEAKDENGEDYISAPLIPDGRVQQMELTSDLKTRENNIKNWVKTNFVSDPDMRVLLRDRMKNFKLSASALTTFIDIIYGGPKSFYESYVLRTDRAPEDWKLVFGNVMHRTMEEITKNGISNEEATKFFVDELENYDTTADIRTVVLDKGLSSLAISLNEFSDIIRNGEAEVKFGYDNIVVEGVPIVGNIDHILINHNNKTIEVFDYKTGKFHPEKWTSQPSLFNYSLQLEFYKLLLNNSPKYHNYRVTKGHILYVTKDDNDEVFDKVYEYPEKIQFEIRNKVDYEFSFIDLLKTVYPLITSLSFVDDPELFIDADKNRNMKQEKEFIKLLLAKTAKK